MAKCIEEGCPRPARRMRKTPYCVAHDRLLCSREGCLGRVVKCEIHGNDDLVTGEHHKADHFNWCEEHDPHPESGYVLPGFYGDMNNA